MDLSTLFPIELLVGLVRSERSFGALFRGVIRFYFKQHQLPVVVGQRN